MNSIEKIKTTLEANLEYKSFPISVKDLEKYNNLYPKAAKIILQDFERISLGRVEHQRKALEAKISLDRLCQWQGFAVSVIMIIGAVICGYFKQEIVAGTLVGVSALGLVRAILPSKGKEKSEIEKLN